MFRRLAARQPFYNWELRFSAGEHQPAEGGVGGAQESGGVGGGVAQEGGASGKADGEGEHIPADQAGEGGRYEGGTIVEQGGGEGGALAVVGEHADDAGGGRGGGELDGEQAGDENEGDALEEKSFKRRVVRLLQLEERWRIKGFQLIS